MTDHVMKLPLCLLNRGEIGNVCETPNEGKGGGGSVAEWGRVVVVGDSDPNARPREIPERRAAYVKQTAGKQPEVKTNKQKNVCNTEKSGELEVQRLSRCRRQETCERSESSG